MTNKELLYKIQNNTELEYCWMALQKVVQFHRNVDGCCSICRSDYWAEDYPCETIQIIEEAIING